MKLILRNTKIVMERSIPIPDYYVEPASSEFNNWCTDFRVTLDVLQMLKNKEVIFVLYPRYKGVYCGPKSNKTMYQITADGMILVNKNVSGNEDLLDIAGTRIVVKCKSDTDGILEGKTIQASVSDLTAKVIVDSL